MLHPSYSDLMRVVNSENDGDAPVVNSRYSIVMATAKRARQIIAGQTGATEAERAKPLSTAVRELNDGTLRIVAAEEPAEDEDIALTETVPGLFAENVISDEEGSDSGAPEDGEEPGQTAEETKTAEREADDVSLSLQQ